MPSRKRRKPRRGPDYGDTRHDNGIYDILAPWHLIGI
jgi:hypothetical protein